MSPSSQPVGSVSSSIGNDLAVGGHSGSGERRRTAIVDVLFDGQTVASVAIAGVGDAIAQSPQEKPAVAPLLEGSRLGFFEAIGVEGVACVPDADFEAIADDSHLEVDGGMAGTVAVGVADGVAEAFGEGEFEAVAAIERPVRQLRLGHAEVFQPALEAGEYAEVAFDR